MAEALSVSSNGQAGWKKRKTPNIAIANEPSTASSTPVSNSRGSRNKPEGAQGPGSQGQKQITHLEDVVVMMAWEILTLKQKLGALRCGAKFLWLFFVTKIGNNSFAEVCEGWCAKQQEKDDGTAHPWACSQRGAAFGCVVSLLNKAATADALSAPRNTKLHPGWSKVGFAEMARTWVATIRADAPSQFMDQFRAMSTLHTDGVITIAAERDNKQSKSEEQLWKWLKNRSKKPPNIAAACCMMVGSTRSRGSWPRTWR